MPRLAAGVARTGRLDPAAMERALEALGRMRDVCERRGVSRISAVATAAVREARNGSAFAKRVREVTGFHLQVIDAEREAQLSYRSVAHHFPLEGGRTVVADIGGGSLELIAAMDGLVDHAAVPPLRRGPPDRALPARGPTRPRSSGSLRQYLRSQFRRRLPVRDWSAPSVIGSGGSFTNLGRMVAARRGGSGAEAVHGGVITAAEVEQLLDWLSGMSPERRAEVPGLNPQRADIIVAGLAVTAELLERIDAREIRISAFGLREGLILEMVGRRHADRRGRPDAPGPRIRRALPLRPPPRRAGALPRPVAVRPARGADRAPLPRSGRSSRPRPCCTTSARS